MNNVPEPSNNLNLDGNKSESPWWNRPVWGEDSLLEDLFSKFEKETVPDSITALHHGSMMDVQVFAKTAKAVDNDRFSNDEFVVYVKIKYALRKGINEYQGLNEPIQLFQAAIEAKNSYITLDQTEIRYRSSKQQELYECVQQLLTNEEQKSQFTHHVKEKLEEVLPQIKTEEGRKAMQAYVQELERLAEYELGLKLLCLFKTYQLADYSILRIISDMVASLKEQDVTNLKTLVALVLNKYEVFEKLGQIIGVNEKQSNPDTYARMIQFVTLSHRHKLSYVKFEELMMVMRKWYKPYQAVARIRTQYSPKEYKIPLEFSEAIPGIEIYDKYSKSLTDKNTGLIYVDFNDE